MVGATDSSTVVWRIEYFSVFDGGVDSRLEKLTERSNTIWLVGPATYRHQCTIAIKVQ